MKQLTVISGKGGTGKTSITAAFASIAKNAVLADCDVDAADLHLILKPIIKKTTDFHGLNIAYIDKDRCIDCKNAMNLVILMLLMKKLILLGSLVKVAVSVSMFVLLMRLQ